MKRARPQISCIGFGTATQDRSNAPTLRRSDPPTLRRSDARTPGSVGPLCLALAIAFAGCKGSLTVPAARTEAVAGTAKVSAKPAPSPLLQAATEEHLTAQKRVQFFEAELKAAAQRELRDARPSARAYRLQVEQALAVARDEAEKSRLMLNAVRSQEGK